MFRGTSRFWGDHLFGNPGRNYLGTRRLRCWKLLLLFDYHFFGLDKIGGKINHDKVKSLLFRFMKERT